MNHLVATILFLVSLASGLRAQNAPRSEIVAVGRDVLLNEDETTRTLVVVSGDATVKGTVQGDMVVISGKATVDGIIQGHLHVVSGNVTLGPEAEIRRGLTLVGGTLSTQPSTRISGKQIVILPESISPGFGWFKQWFGKGLLWARPFPPQFRWLWVMAGAFLAGYVLLNLLFPRPAQACVDAVEHQPVASFFLGLFLLAFSGPLIVILVISIFGLILLPFLLCGLFGALLLGKLAVYRHTGQQILKVTGLGTLSSPVPAILLGTVIFFASYMIPILGFAVWGAVACMGAGAAVLASLRSLRGEVKSVNPEMPLFSPALARVGFWWRFCATALDFVIVGVGCAVLHAPKIFFPVWVLYHLILWSWLGTTLGGMILGLRIVKEDGGPLDVGTSLVRVFASFFSALVLFLGFFWAGWTRRKQSWHDRIAGTVVIRGKPSAEQPSAEQSLPKSQMVS
jgi:uncharacterized RDD family membrane protein YckC